MLVSPSTQAPWWLQVLLSEKFFSPCVTHEEFRKNEKNIFCLDCCISICPHCLTPHGSHRLLQIRRYIYHDVLRLEEAARLIDCSFIQSYTTNSAKVVFLNQRPQTRQLKGSGNTCFTCERSLQYPSLFCSLFCKIDYFLRTQGGVSKLLFDCKFLPLSDEGLMTPSSALTSSDSGGNGGVTWCKTLACTATTEIVRKKRSSLKVCLPAAPETPASLNNRRKKTPHRAPFY